MSPFLGFTLYAPLGSFGSIAVGERRETWDRPAKSAVLGLVGAALGIDRADERKQTALAGGYGYAARSDAPGQLLADYHTAQVPPRKRGFPTRREELASEKLETILSRRDYRVEALHTVLLWPRDGAPATLESIAAALNEPRFVLYLGRKTCPLGLSLAPRIVEGETITSAFSAYDESMSAAERSLRHDLGLAANGNGRIAMDTDPPVPHGGRAMQREHRRDAFVSREGWRFELRDELVLLRLPSDNP
jgi:CRISPR system Cascade subunit CasD